MHFIRHITNFLGAQGNAGVCTLNQEEITRLQEVVQGGDNLEALNGVIGGCNTLVFNSRLNGQLEEMIRLNRQAIFEHVVPLLSFPPPGLGRASRLTFLLQKALYFHNLTLADFLMGQGARPMEHDDLRGSWVSVQDCAFREYQQYSLEQHRQFIDRHPGMARDLSPTPTDLRYVARVEEAILLIELAQYCRTFTPEFVRYLASNYCLGDAQKAQIVGYMLDHRMAVGGENALRFFEMPGNGETYQVIEESLAPQEVKEPASP